MIVATLARKPLKGAVIDNVVRHEAGALNVDACRIGTDTVVIQGGGGAAWDDAGNKVGLPMGRIREERIGRFPANLVLVHLAGCFPAGAAKMPVNENGGGKLWSHYRDGKIDQAVAVPSRIGVGGQETVTLWECAEGCPAAEMDRVDSGGASRFFLQVKKDET